MTSLPQVRWRFGLFEVDLESGELRKAGRRVRLQDKPLIMLAALLEQPGHVITRQHLRDRLWSADVFVDFDNGLNNAANKLRFALGDNVSTPRFIETVGRRGYRYIGPAPERMSDETAPTGATLANHPSDGGEPPPVPPFPHSSHETGSTEAERTADIAGLAGSEVPGYILGLKRGVLAAASMAAAALLISAAIARPGWFEGFPSASAWSRVSAVSEIKGLAVMPLTDAAAQPGDDGVGYGLTEALTTRLARLAPLKVISHSSVKSYAAQGILTPAAIGRALGVDTLVEGSVDRSGSNIRVNLRLVDVESERLLWAESYVGTTGDLLSVHASALSGLIGQVRNRMAPSRREARLDQGPANSPAYESYLRGLFSMQEGGAGAYARALGYFSQALTSDPQYAEAHAGLGLTRLLLETFGDRPPLGYKDEARAAIETALDLDPTLPEAHVAKAFYLRLYDWDWAGAEVGFKRAIELNPSFVTAHIEYEFLLLSLARLDDAIASARAATTLDPLSAGAWANEGQAYHAARRYDEAEHRFMRALEITPGHRFTLWNLILLRIDQERFAEALQLLRTFEGAGVLSPARKAFILAAVGDRATATRLMAGESFRKDKARAAMVYGLLGEKDRAFDLLAQTMQDRSMQPLALLDAGFDSIRRDPRFEDILRQFRLPEASIQAMISLGGERHDGGDRRGRPSMQ